MTADEPSLDRRRPRQRLVIVLMIAAVYAPFFVPLGGEHLSGDSSCRDSWLELLPVMPGLVLTVVTGTRSNSDVLWYLTMGAITVLQVAALVLIARRSIGRMLLALALGLLFSGLSAGFASALFAM